MAVIDNVLELGLGVTWLAVTLVVAYAALSWLYALVFVGGSAIGALVALVFVGFGAVIVYGTVALYAPTTNPVGAFRRLLGYEWADQAYYHCEACGRSYTQPGHLEGLDCPYCGSGAAERLAG